ncbi:MAG: hypothetical protein GY765_01325 [bacterium]|nr:hypothetical protein [bacterium]
MKIWKEKLDPQKHKDYMSSYWIGGDDIKAPKDNLIDSWIFFVKECGFTFQFTSIAQLDECLNYFSQKVHASTRREHDGLEYDWQAWYERLPGGLIKNSKREKILKSLEAAKEKFK